MKVNRGYVFRLYPTPAQAGALAHAVGVCRLVYNLALEQRRDHWRQFRRAEGKAISVASQCRELTALRAEFDWVAAVSQTAQQQALRDLDRAYQNFFEGLAAYPSFRRKGENDSFRVHGREVAVRRLNRNWGVVKLPKVGEVRFRWTRAVPGTIRNATVRLDPLGWHVSLAAEFEVEAPKNFGPALGADRGVVKAVAYSDGTFAAFPRKTVSRLERRARDAAHALSKCRKGSARRKVAKARVAALRAKLARVRKHFNHVETARLARTYGIVCLEYLRIQAMTASARGTVEEPGRNVAQKAGLNRAILEVGWGQFRTFLEYKTAAAGGEVRLVPAAHTSTTCASCGHRDASSRESQAVFRCTGCGMSANADTNAARNILRAGTRPCDARRVSPAKRRGSRQGGGGPRGLTPDWKSPSFRAGKTLTSSRAGRRGDAAGGG